jgi:hypothetical protein
VSRGRRGVLLAVLAAVAAAGPASAAPPANDEFEAAQALTTGVAAVGSNVEATAQFGEPIHSTWVAANRSVWFTWTAPATGLARVSSCGSDFDSVVAVYGGSMLSGLYATKLANNDNGCGPPTYASVVYLRVQAGTTYRVVLDGWTASDAGNYQLVAEMLGDPGPPPPNDDVGAAVTLTGDTATASGTNVGATSGWNEWPSRATQLVWWRWVSPVDGQVRVDTCNSGFDTILGVMRRDSGEWAGGDIASDGCGDRGAVTMNAVAGQEYWIGVGGDGGASGAVDLRIDSTPDLTAPVTTISSGPSGDWGRRVARFSWSVADEAATRSECSIDDGPWYSCPNSEELGGLDEGDHTFAVRSVDQYGNQESPGARRDYRVVIPEAPNDDFGAATELVPGVPVAVNNGKASAEPGEPAHDAWYYAQGLSANWSVWFKFTPPADAVAELDWCASGFEVTTAVYTGDDVAALDRVDHEDEDCRLDVPVSAGVTYRVAIDGFAQNLTYGTGPISLVLGYAGSAGSPGPGGEGSPGTGGGSSSPEAPGPQPGDDGNASQASLRVAGERPLSAAVAHSGRFSVRRVRVRCGLGPGCTVGVKVLARRGGSRRLGGATFRMGPGTETLLRARLNRATRRVLLRRGRIGARLQVALPGGRTRTLSVVLLAR